MATMHEIDDVARQIARQFAPERIVLFGSHAYGAPRPDSDVDFLVLLPFEGKSFRKALDIRNAVNPRFNLDIIARTPGEAHRRCQWGAPLIRGAFDKGKVLYERRGA